MLYKLYISKTWKKKKDSLKASWHCASKDFCIPLRTHGVLE